MLCVSALIAQSGAAQTPLNFVAVTPCRVADTRNAAGAFGGPTMQGGETRSFAIPASACNIPPLALAYSVNVTVVPAGPLGFLTLWPTGLTQPLVSTLNALQGQVAANAAIVPAGTNGAVNVFVSNTTDVILDVNGYFAAESYAGNESTAVGSGASALGNENSAFGFDALSINSTGAQNTAMGALALSTNASGHNNVAMGFGALASNTTGSANTALGTQALLTSQIGVDNIAIGFSALSGSTAGSNNIAIGVNAAGNVVVGGNNIDIGSSGASDKSGAIRVGTIGKQTSVFIAGINSATVTGSAVLIDATTGQLGIATSSERYKDDIRDMGNASDALLQLRPVTFYYKQPAEHGTKPLQFGLVGEEVAKVYPELVVYDRNGQVQSVEYHQLPALLLNELQKQHKTIEDLETRIAALEAVLHAGTTPAH